jgi:hypothetical protein
MADYGIALLAIGVVVGIVLLGVAGVAYLGMRYGLRGPSTATRRRLASAEIALGALMLAYLAVALAFGGGFAWVLGVIQGPLLILLGWAQLRDLKTSTQRAAK